MSGGGGGQVTEGSAEPLGACIGPGGVNFAVWSRNATAVEVCLFAPDGVTETARIPLPGRTGPVFHGFVAGLGAGALYGLRVHGPHAPARGLRFNPHKLLADPWALALDRPFGLQEEMFDRSGPDGPLDAVDSAAVMPKAVIIAEADLPAPPGPPPAIPWGETVIYELHVRGFTKAHPDVPEGLRGTFAGLAHPAAVARLLELGVTSVELMPAAAWIDERHLGPLGLTNYWGYNPIALLAPDPRLAPGGWAEVRAAVDALAAAGIETLVDVVLNHTGEGDEAGPTVSFRGLDNAAWYRLNPDSPAHYLNDAGTGSTLALNRPPGLRLAMEALRAWRRFGGVAGFRFDLASVMGRGDRAGGDTGFDPAAALLAAIDQDPELRGLKLIAEPWDCGPGGYQLGAFPPAWGEWNDRFRDTARGFWRGDGVSRGELARRLAGSEDAFGARRPSRSINFVVAHDGFTLADLVAYETKHNEANGEANRDGTDHNLSWNHGAEGPTGDPAIRAARLGDQRALLATLLLARGTPMLAMGAESGQSQGGNNNAYAQDNGLTWLDWTGADASLTAFTARLIGLRRAHPALRADRFLSGAPGSAGLCPDVAWTGDSGAELDPHGWDDPAGRTLVMVLAEPVGDGLDRVAVAFHRGAAAASLVLPEPRDGFAWRIEADSADPDRAGEAPDGPLALAPRSVLLAAEVPSPGRRPRGTDDRVLTRLARAAGIAPDWRGADGQGRTVTPETSRALLAAMGLDASTSWRARESLARLAGDHDRRALPFALTARDGEPFTVRLGAPRAGPPPRTWLLIEGASGLTHRLRADPDAGREVEARGRDGVTARALDLLVAPLPPGRYVLRREDRPDLACALTVAPRACHAPAALAGNRRLWGLSAQIYALSRAGDQGIGDFTTLGDLAEAGAARGASILGINPLHTLFEQDRERASPYYPSDRRFLDPLYLDLAQVPFARGSAADAPESGRLIDYPAVWAFKAAALEAAFVQACQDSALDAFIAAGGETLRRFALFQALAEARAGEAWSAWPAALRDPAGAEAAQFAAAHGQRLRFHAWVQQQCAAQLAGAASRAAALPLGLCRDLALGAAPDGAELWAQAAIVAGGVSIGAPPDPLGPLGQVWGLPPFDPHRLRAEGYRGMDELFAANMAHAGALRIDHVMGLARQFWIPDGGTAMDGAYVSFPFADLLGRLALASVEAGCLVIGEDLGTVPEGFRDNLAEVGVQSYRVLPFERDSGVFIPPAAWPRQAWACVSTHDLPTLTGWWDGADIEEREALGLTDEAQAQAARSERLADRAALIAALAQAQLADGDTDPDRPLTPELAGAIHALVARTPCALAIAQVEDLAGEREAVNLPGTDRERPNWRRRLETPVERLFDGELAAAIVAALRAERPQEG